LTNEEVLPIIQKDALMSLVQWSQAHGQKLKPTELGAICAVTLSRFTGEKGVDISSQNIFLDDS
jgi:hypothetical protein